jgi:hypothetical protein
LPVAGIADAVIVKLVPPLLAEIKYLADLAADVTLQVTLGIVTDSSYWMNIWLLLVTAVVSTAKLTALPAGMAINPAGLPTHAALPDEPRAAQNDELAIVGYVNGAAAVTCCGGAAE